jgi:hypothetical protein
VDGSKCDRAAFAAHRPNSLAVDSLPASVAHSLLAPRSPRGQKKPRRFTEVKRRGRNREEAVVCCGGIKKISQSPIASLRMVMLNRLPTLPPVHCDHTRSNPHVQLFVALDRKNISAYRNSIAINNRYFLTRKVLRQNRTPSPQPLPKGAFSR